MKNSSRFLENVDVDHDNASTCLSVDNLREELQHLDCSTMTLVSTTSSASFQSAKNTRLEQEHDKSLAESMVEFESRINWIDSPKSIQYQSSKVSKEIESARQHKTNMSTVNEASVIARSENPSWSNLNTLNIEPIFKDKVAGDINTTPQYPTNSAGKESDEATRLMNEMEEMGEITFKEFRAFFRLMITKMDGLKKGLTDEIKELKTAQNINQTSISELQENQRSNA